MLLILRRLFLPRGHLIMKVHDGCFSQQVSYVLYPWQGEYHRLLAWVLPDALLPNYARFCSATIYTYLNLIFFQPFFNLIKENRYINNKVLHNQRKPETKGRSSASLLSFMLSSMRASAWSPYLFAYLFLFPPTRRPLQRLSDFFFSHTHSSIHFILSYQITLFLALVQ